MTGGLGDGSAGGAVGIGGVATGPMERVGDGFWALDGVGVQAARVIATNATARPNRPLGTSKTSDDLTERLAERNALD
jgi:hypothetical protein